VNILREYLGLQFKSLIEGVQSNIERVIMDLSFCIMLFGKDFVPYLDMMEISDGILDMAFDIYASMKPKMKGFVIEIEVNILAKC